MKYTYSLILILLMISQGVFALQQKQTLSFKTGAGHTIKVIKEVIFYDHKKILKIDNEDIFYQNKANRLIEDHGTIFLFIATNGAPNCDRLKVFLITPSKATLVADAILSPLKDDDADGYLEFGGADLTEMHPNPDSAYYVPSQYYEIRRGKIHPDNALTKSKDIAINGLYLSPKNQPDKHGYCCKVIPAPRKKHKSDAQRK